jgi:alpha-glucosidase
MMNCIPSRAASVVIPLILLAARPAAVPAGQPEGEGAQGPIAVRSPDGALEIVLELKDLGGKTGVPVFGIAFRGRKLVEDGRLGVDLADVGPLVAGLRASRVARRREDRTSAVFPGKTSALRERFEEADVDLEETAPPARRLGLVLRAYDDGVAFRYRFPGTAPGQGIRILEERTAFAFEGDPKAYALPLKGFATSYEGSYSVGPLAKVKGSPLIGLPLLIEYPERIWVGVTEADLTDYAGLYLEASPASTGLLEGRLSPLPGRAPLKVEARTPHVSPWRVVMVADSPGRLIESNLVLAMNEPCALADTSWIRPGKTTFPWWNGFEVGETGFRGGLDTRTALHYIDFCAEQGIPYHSLDGLDVAWYGGPIVPYEGADITKSPSIDLPAVLEHARKKGVRLRLWMHWQAADRHMDRAFPIYEKWGIEGVMVDFLDRDDQEMVRFEHRLVKKAAEHHLTVTLHGIHKPTGVQRTYPNLLTYEGVLNLEYDKWSEVGSSPGHELLVPFTRMLAGPLDYHQGCFRSVRPKDFAPRNVAPRVMGTRARMLAMYVAYEDPLPMMADYPEAYRGQPGLGFVVRVPTVWDETRVLAAEVGHLLAVARRGGGAWYIGAMTDGEAREAALPLSFLGAGEHVLELYADPSDPLAPATRVVESRSIVDASTVLRARLAPAGGAAMRIAPASKEESGSLPRHPAGR